MLRLLASALSLCPCLVLAEDPPRPDPKNPVDYVKWCNEHYGGKIEKNAGDFYEKAFALKVVGEADPDALIHVNPSDWEEEKVEAIRRWFSDNAERVALFEKATRVPQCYFTLRTERIDLGGGGVIEKPEWKEAELAALEIGYYSHMRAMAKFLVARARIHFVEGRTERGMGDLATLLRAAAHLYQQPRVTDYLVAGGVADLIYSLLRHLPQSSYPELDYDVVLRVLREADRKPPVAVWQLDYSLVEAFDMLQCCLRDEDGDGLYGRYAYPDPESGMALRPARRLPGIVRDLEQLREAWRRVYAMDNYSAARRAAEKLEGGFWRRSMGNAENLDALMKERIAAQGPGAEAFAFGWSMMVHGHHLALGKRNATRIVLNLHAFRAKHGRWPKDLKEGMAEELPRFRRDPFSGEDFVYRLKDGQPLLYSFGVDGDDDGGRRAPNQGPDADGDWVFWPPAEE